MNSFNFQIVEVDSLASIPLSFPEHICYFTKDTDNYYIWKDGELKEIFVDTSSLTWNNITNTPTTVTGYGITDAVTACSVPFGTPFYPPMVCASTGNGLTYQDWFYFDRNQAGISTQYFTPASTNPNNPHGKLLHLDPIERSSSFSVNIDYETVGLQADVTLPNSSYYNSVQAITGSLSVSDSFPTLISKGVNTFIGVNAIAGKSMFGDGHINASPSTSMVSIGLRSIASASTTKNIGGDFISKWRVDTSGENIGIQVSASGKVVNTGFNIEVGEVSDTNRTNIGGNIVLKSDIGGTNYGLKINMSQALGTSYSLQLQDGTEQTGKFLKSVTDNGEANWANITAADVSGAIGGSGTENYLSKWTPNGSTLGDSQIQDNGNTIGYKTNPRSSTSHYFLSTGRTTGKYLEFTYSGSDSVAASDAELFGSITSSFTQEAVGYGISVGITNPTPQGVNYGFKSTVSGADTNIGASFSVTGGSQKHAIQLQDGTEALGKFLKVVGSNGKANWANITTADIQGYQASSFSISESKAIFVDATYGNNTTGEKYNPAKPYLTWTAAIAVAVSGDWIVFNAGTYSVSMTPVNNVNVFCKPGVIFTSGFRVSSSITWRLHGYAEFNATVPLYINSSGATHDIYFEFDRTSGLCGTGLECLDLTATMLKLTFNCNYLTASRPLVFDNNATGATYDVVVNVSQKILGYGDKTIFLPSSFTAGNLYGSIVINANVIEHTSSATYRQVLWMGPSNTNNFEMHINAKLIKATSTTFNDLGDSNFSAVLIFLAGDNVNINANIDAGEIPCIINHSNGSTYAVGNMTITGNIFSKREIVQQYQKFANGNGWHDVTIKNGFIHSKGLGLSNSMFHRQNNWNSMHGGIPGNTRLVNCIVYNENTNASATATIIKDDLLDVGKNNNFQLYNCLAFVETSGFLATSIQATKYISAHNVRTNRALGSTVLDGFSPSGVIVDANLTIPKTNINV